ncbi:hypothetical protein [Lamprocystis purpurea]|uniref:hypothetical protein n=1 Tax=Lamprocystis purpurea TaxID=61598 RepID=UPI0012FB2D5B|nr:hypothetical protein [Lamprocystis purpurea]
MSIPMRIRALRILPPLAIGRLGSGAEPLVAYEIEADPEHPLDIPRIKGAVTFRVDGETGEIVDAFIPEVVSFKEVRTPEADTDGETTEHIRPVAPFLEVWTQVEGDQWVPLTLEILLEEGLTPADVTWQVTVANRKVARRTANPDDAVSAQTPWFSTHGAQPLRGHCRNFVDAEVSIALGQVQYIKPTACHPEIRLRFTPAPGKIYGPRLDSSELQELYGASWQQSVWTPPPEQAVYDPGKDWLQFGKDDGDPSEQFAALQTLPPSLYAIVPPGPCWLNDNIAVSRGYLDDTCDGVVEVRLHMGSVVLEAAARICSGPPAVLPDTVFLRTLADDLDQVIHGPWVPTEEHAEETRERALDIVRRAFDTVRFLNVAVMNGNPVNGRDPLDFDTMPAEEAFDVYRMMRPIVPERTADSLMIMALHQQVYAALQGGASPWFAHALRLPTEVGDFTDHGRRKMPAMMCGADGGYLALTYRQINAILRCSGLPLHPGPEVPETNPQQRLIARNRHAQIHHVAAGNPFASRPEMSVGNCTPGLEMDFRAVWRRLFEGIVLREYDSLVMEMEPIEGGPALPDLVGHRLLRVDDTNLYTQMIGPSPYNPRTRTTVLGFTGNPDGVLPLEWSNALAQILNQRVGQSVDCYFTKTPVWSTQALFDVADAQNTLKLSLRVRPFFEDGSAMISRTLAKPGELTQGLCSPWQNDYRECSCYYWASARPDFVNVKPNSAGASEGDNWMQKERTGDYVPDDYRDARLLNYDDLFRAWEHYLRFQIGGVERDRTADAPPTGNAST